MGSGGLDKLEGLAGGMMKALRRFMDLQRGLDTAYVREMLAQIRSSRESP